MPARLSTDSTGGRGSNGEEAQMTADSQDSTEPRKARLDSYIDLIAVLDFPSPPQASPSPLQRPSPVTLNVQLGRRELVANSVFDRGVPEGDLSRLLYPGLSSISPSSPRSSRETPDRANAPSPSGRNAWETNEQREHRSHVDSAMHLSTDTQQHSSESKSKGRLEGERGHSRNDSGGRHKLQVFGPLDQMGTGDFPSLNLVSNFDITSQRRPSVESVGRSKPMHSSSKLERLLGTSAYASAQQSHSLAPSSARGSNDDADFRHLRPRSQASRSHDRDDDRLSFIDLDDPSAHIIEYIPSEDTWDAPSTGRSDDSGMPSFAKRRPESFQNLRPSAKRAGKSDVMGFDSPRNDMTRTLDPSSSIYLPSRAPTSLSAVVDLTEPRKGKKSDLPPTINALDPTQRADLLRKTKKLAQVFGETPQVEMLYPGAIPDIMEFGIGPPSPVSPRKLRHRSTRSSQDYPASRLGQLQPFYFQETQSSWSVLNRDTVYMTAEGRQAQPTDRFSRRHSTPPTSPLEFTSYLSPKHESFVSSKRESNSDSEMDSLRTKRTSRRADGSLGSPTSFFDLSDEEEGRIGLAESPETPRQSLTRGLTFDGPSSLDQMLFAHRTTRPLAHNLSDHHNELPSLAQEDSPTAPSFFSDNSAQKGTTNLDLDERRKKRERMAKLHRFLGSRVPAELVLGHSRTDTEDLPPIANSVTGRSEADRDKSWMNNVRTRRRSSSAAAYRPGWEADLLKEIGLASDERTKADLTEEERMIQVKRAQKMGKLFGTQPPQTLYQNRPPAPADNAFSLFHNSSAYSTQRPSIASTHADSITPLMASSRNRQFSIDDTPSLADDGFVFIEGSSPPHTKSVKPPRPPKPDYRITATYPPRPQESEAEHQQPNLEASPYIHFRNSLQSLNHIIDTDDRQSLQDLHGYLNEFISDPEHEHEDRDRRSSKSSHSTRSSRRRSLPARTSMVSIQSVDTFSTMSPPIPDEFQTRRKRAAKLTHFFGVDYRQLFGEVLDSIENGVLEEGHRGNLSPDEQRELLERLVVLKQRRDEIN